MLTLNVTEKGGTPKRMEFDKDEVTVGRVPGNDIVLPKGNVSKRHSQVFCREGRFFVADLKSTNGTYLNGRRITTPSVIRPGDKIYIGDFVVTVDMGDLAGAMDDAGDDGAQEPDAGAPAADDGGYDDSPETPEPQRAGGFGPPPLGGRPGPGAPPAMGRPSSPNPMSSPSPMGGSPEPRQTSPLAPAGGPPRSTVMGPGSPGAGPMGGGGPPPLRPGSGGPMPPIGGRGPSMPMESPMGGPPMGSPMGGPPMGAPPMSGSPMGGPPMGVPPMGGSPMGGPPMGGSPMGGMGPAPSLGGPPPSMGSAPSLGGPPPSFGGPPPSLGGPPPSLGGPPPSLGGPPPSLGGPPPSLGGPPPSLGGPPAGYGAPPPSFGGPAPSFPSQGMSPMSTPLAPPVNMPTAAEMPQREVIPMAPNLDEPTRQPDVAAAVAMSRPLEPASIPSGAPVSHASPMPAVRAASRPSAHGGDEYQELLAQVVRGARSRGAESAIGDEVARARLRPTVEQAARSLPNLPNGVTPERLTRDALAEIAGAGPFDTLIEDGEITTIIVESTGVVSVGRSGVVGPSGYCFSSSAAAVEGIDRLLRSHGIDRGGRSSVDATLRDGARLVAVFPPVAINGPVASVERAPARATTLNDLAARGALSPNALPLIHHALQSRRNVLVVGGAGSGRTTLVSALLSAVPATDRVAIVEARDELGRVRRDAAVLHADGDSAAAVDAAVRMRTHRLVFGDLTPAAARAVLHRLVTGAEGILAVVDAPGAHAGLLRVAGEGATGSWITPAQALARLAASRPLVIETSRLGDGTCRVVGISEARPAGDGVHLESLFGLRIDGVDAQGSVAAQLVPTGAAPSF
ncbi:MAG: domain containing protein [Myxococcaceae bacterium]|nr:domain containing protein [Myxococcaceae bacterium]